MSHQINLESFSGPLDLLLFFIKRDEIDIMDIPISKITSDYLNAIKDLEQINLSNAGDFIYMASSLMRIKAKMLLPLTNDNNEEEFDDPRIDLANKLIEYQKFKNISNDLKNMYTQQLNFFPFNFKYIQKEKDYNNFNLEKISLFEFASLFKTLIEKKPIQINYDLKKEKIRVKEKISFILKQLFDLPKIFFSKLFNRKSQKDDIVVTFVAILELIQNKRIKVTQKSNFDEILIEKIKIK
tara:strand:+ start:6500 stop:7219 length:720 start_codon:yes stop_codon:yes gene_type:complete